MGWSGNLTTGEILEQIVHADRILADEWNIHKTPRLELVRNVVFMGMGYVRRQAGIRMIVVIGIDNRGKNRERKKEGGKKKRLKPISLTHLTCKPYCAFYSFYFFLATSGNLWIIIKM
jgi:hypothetical protein